MVRWAAWAMQPMKKRLQLLVVASSDNFAVHALMRNQSEVFGFLPIIKHDVFFSVWASWQCPAMYEQIRKRWD
jgi:hypothetical protein